MYTTNIIPVEQRIKEYKEAAVNNNIIKEGKNSRKISTFFSKFLG